MNFLSEKDSSISRSLICNISSGQSWFSYRRSKMLYSKDPFKHHPLFYIQNSPQIVLDKRKIYEQILETEKIHYWDCVVFFYFTFLFHIMISSSFPDLKVNLCWAYHIFTSTHLIFKIYILIKIFILKCIILSTKDGMVVWHHQCYGHEFE